MTHRQQGIFQMVIAMFGAVIFFHVPPTDCGWCYSWGVVLCLFCALCYIPSIIRGK